jgi:hypothetical protein
LNPRSHCWDNGFQDRRIRPLCHSSKHEHINKTKALRFSLSMPYGIYRINSTTASAVALTRLSSAKSHYQDRRIRPLCHSSIGPVRLRASDQLHSVIFKKRKYSGTYPSVVNHSGCWPFIGALPLLTLNK